MSRPPPLLPPHGLRPVPRLWHNDNDQDTANLSAPGIMTEHALVPSHWRLRMPGQGHREQMGRNLFSAQRAVGHARPRGQDVVAGIAPMQPGLIAMDLAWTIWVSSQRHELIFQIPLNFQGNLNRFQLKKLVSNSFLVQKL
jgi:hypothetical protein